MYYPTDFTREIALRGAHTGEHALLRPACELDIPGIRAYLLAMPQEERYLRYMGTIALDTLITDSRLNRRYHLDYNTHIAFLVVTKAEEVLGVAHAHGPVVREEGRYETSYSRRADYKGSGVGTALLEGLLDWGHARKIPGFFADTLIENTRMRALFEAFTFDRVVPHPDHDLSLARYRLGLCTE